MNLAHIMMLSCRQANVLQSAQRDRALTLGERSRLRRHLAVCASCHRIDGQYRAMGAALKRLGQ